MKRGRSNHRLPNGPGGSRLWDSCCSCTRDRGLEFAVDSNLSGKLVTSAGHAVTPGGALVSAVETNVDRQL